MRLGKTRCVQCGGPLSSFDPDAQCTYCLSLQPEGAASAELRRAVRDVLQEERDGHNHLAQEPGGATLVPRNARWIFLGAGVAFLLGVCAMFLLWTVQVEVPPSVVEVASPAPMPQQVVVVPPPPVVEAPPPPVVPPRALPVAPARRVAPPPPLTKEAWAKQRIDARASRLRECVEQDLLHFPDAPKAYTVTLTIQRKGVPLNSETRFTPEPSKGFYDCARFALYYGFLESEQFPKLTEDFVHTAAFAFPDAVPATQAKHGIGWD